MINPGLAAGSRVWHDDPFGVSECTIILVHDGRVIFTESLDGDFQFDRPERFYADQADAWAGRAERLMKEALDNMIDARCAAKRAHELDSQRRLTRTDQSFEVRIDPDCRTPRVEVNQATIDAVTGGVRQQLRAQNG